MLKFGTISEVIADKGMARVKFDDDEIVSAPLHCSVPISLKDQMQFPYFVNQHVWCTMDDRCERGVIGGAVYDEGNTPAGGSADIVKIKFDQGLEIKYDRATKKLSVTGTGDVEIDTDGQLDASVSGDANVSCQNANVSARVEVKVSAVTKITLDAPEVEATGILMCASIQTTVIGGSGLRISPSGVLTTTEDINSTGTIMANVVKQGDIVLAGHKHNGVTAGGGVSGTPIP